MERLEQRITELERRASRYRNALVLLVVGMCGVAVVGATNRSLYGIDEDGIITGKTLYLVNDEGKLAVGLGSDDGGNGMLHVYSITGELLMALGEGANGFQIQGYNKTGEGVVQLTADDYGNGVVGAFNRKGMGRTLIPGP